MSRIAWMSCLLWAERKKNFFFKNSDDMSTYLTNTVEGKEAKLIVYKFFIFVLVAQFEP